MTLKDYNAQKCYIEQLQSTIDKFEKIANDLALNVEPDYKTTIFEPEEQERRYPNATLEDVCFIIDAYQTRLKRQIDRLNKQINAEIKRDGGLI